MLASTSTFSILSNGYQYVRPGPLMQAQLNLPLPLEMILRDVSRAIDAQLYYPALCVALTLPDICVGLTFDKERFIKEKDYVAFVDTYTTPPELGLEGQSCYRLRGGVIHRGNAAGHPFFGSTHVIFTVPGGPSIHALTLQVDDKAAACFDVVMFCRAMDHAARRWYADHKDNLNVVKNIPNLLSWRPNGVSPFVGGLPVVASGT